MDRVVEQDRIHRILQIDRRNCGFIGGCAFAVFAEPVLPRVDDFDVSGNKILGKMYYSIHARAPSVYWLSDDAPTYSAMGWKKETSLEVLDVDPGHSQGLCGEESVKCH